MEYQQQLAQFVRRAEASGLAPVRDFYWYHTIELGDGLIAPGMYDYRASLPAFRFPESMRGMRVLDVGPATGFFAFEFERRGAYVVSVELPSLDALDRFPGQTTEHVVSKLGRMLASCRPAAAAPPPTSAAELYHALLEGPFQFSKQRLNSNVERRYSAVYNPTLDQLGGVTFDLVFVGDVLVHTLYPLRALAALAPLCKGTLVLSQDIPDHPSEPAMLYVSGAQPEIARNSVESQRPSTLLAYAAAAWLASGFRETVLAKEASSSGISRNPRTLRNCLSATSSSDPTQRSI